MNHVEDASARSTARPSSVQESTISSPTAVSSAPNLARVLEFVRQDALAGRLEFWGTSTVVDENTGLPSFDEELFTQLHQAAGMEANFPVGNAGLIHVYGYWFSEVPTPYGLKRERWQNGHLAQAFGLSPQAFRLHDGSGGQEPSEGEQEDGTATVGAESAEGSPQGMRSTPLQRVTEVALPSLLNPPPQARVAEVDVEGDLTRVVCLPSTPLAPAALVYGIRSLAEGRGQDEFQLVTTFPVSGGEDAIFQEFLQEPRYRWNASKKH